MVNNKSGYRSPLPILFIVFFIFIIALNVSCIYLSHRAYNGVVTHDPYVKGIQYNSVLKQNKLQLATGWRGRIFITKLNNQHEYRLTFMLKGIDTPISDASVKARIMRPVSSGHDQYVDLTSNGYGIYTTKLKLLLLGQWDIAIFARTDDNEFYHSQRVELHY